VILVVFINANRLILALSKLDPLSLLPLLLGDVAVGRALLLHLATLLLATSRKLLPMLLLHSVVTLFM
jgi:hypothetical protein